jgi:DNA primase catalytic core
MSDQIKQINLPEIIKSYSIQEGPRNNGTYNYCCPFHDDTNPSLKVNYKDNKWLWHCFGCGAGGDVVRFVEMVEKISAGEAIRKLEGQAIQRSVVVPTIPTDTKLSIEAQRLLNKTVEFYHSAFFEKRDAFNYLVNQRKIYEKNIFETFKVGYADGSLMRTLPPKGEVIDYLKECGILNQWGREHFKDCVIFPVTDVNGNCVEIYGRKIVGSDIKHLYLKGSHKGVFNRQIVKTNKTVILTEGILDALSVYQAGFKNVIPLYGTNGLTKDHLELFKTEGVREIYLCMDADEAGRRAAGKHQEHLSRLGMKAHVIELPQGTDANEYFKEHESKDFEELIARANPKNSLKSDAAAGTEEIETLKDGLKVSYGRRQYIIRGIEALNHQKLRVNVKATGDRRFHIDTVELYSAKARKGFAKEVSLLYGQEPDIIEDDLNRIIVHLEEYITGKNNGVVDPYVMPEDEKREALAFLQAKNLIENVLNDFDILGCCGERMNKLMGYLSAVSRKMDDPLSLLMLSRSAAGKSMLQDTILKMVPDEDKYKYTRITGQALFYKGEDSLKHKLVAIEEEEGSNAASYSIRTMQSSKKLTIASTMKDPMTGAMKTQEYEVNGPLSIMITTTSNEIDYETMNRFIVLTIDESQEQTQLIHQKQRERDTLKGMLSEYDSHEVIKRHQNAQRLLKPVKVVNLYAPYLRFMDDQLRSRRDHKKYLNLIKVVAFLHQYQRERKTIDHKGEKIEYIEVSLKDIALANKIANDVLGRSLDELSPQSRKLLMLTRAMVQEVALKARGRSSKPRFSRRDIREYTKWSDHQIRDHLRQLVDLEYIIVMSGRNGSRMLYELMYDGGGEDGGKFFMGLTDVDEIEARVEYEKLAHEKDDLAGSLRQPCGSGKVN